MRAVIQRVRAASVVIDGREQCEIGPGLLVLLAVESADTPADIDWLSGKIVRLRIFADNQGLMNRSVVDVAGEIMLISQFTLLASTRKGNRPSFERAAKPAVAIPLFEQFTERLTSDLGRPVKTGVFGADMLVTLANDGPVTILLDSQHPE